MRLKYSARAVKELEVGTVVLFVPEFEQITEKYLKELDATSGGSITTLLQTGEFAGKEGETATIYGSHGYKAGRVVLVGLGKKKTLDPDSFRKAAGTVSRYKGLITSVKAAFYLGKFEKPEFVQATMEGYLLGAFKMLEFKTGDNKKNRNVLEEITFVLDNSRVLARAEKAVERGRIIAEGQILARTLGETPSNYMTPSILASQAQTLAKKYGLKCQVLDEKAIEREKMGSFLSVAKGSIEPPRFIILEYKGAAAGRAPIVLVGKGVTFDTGGISLKPSLDMHEMKSDMSGAAAVLSTIVTAARLKVPQNVVALIPATENVPSATATKPGDIVVSRKGVTIEIINTDAEGRLILADALDYAGKYKPQAVIDIATLTGAALIVLGYAGAPIMGNNPKLMQLIKKAAGVTAEKVWELPIWQEYRDWMKSDIADVRNSHGRPAGTITAAAFLEYFIGDYPWAHIDIGNVDIEPKGRPYVPSGVTGAGTRLLVEVLSGWKKP